MGMLSIIRLGLVQSAIGAVMVLITAILNRIMVVEMQMVASIPAALVAWHYAVQLSRPVWGYGSDAGGNRTQWILGGMGTLALGAVLATNATLIMGSSPVAGTIVGVVAYAMIGAGVGAGGTSLLALLTTGVSPERRPLAAATTWVMMIFGIVFTAGVTSHVLDPYSPQRLALVSGCVALAAFLISAIAVRGVERKLYQRGLSTATRETASFREAMDEMWNEPLARRFTAFIFLSMLGYSAQELILEPYAGLVFDYSVGKSTALAGVQHGGVLIGMILVGLAGTLVKGDRTKWLIRSTFAGCLASALAILGLSWAGLSREVAILTPVVFALGFANGMFSVSAIGLMMATAGVGRRSREGVRMGVWGATQAIAFAVGGFVGAAGLDAARQVFPTGTAFFIVFALEALVFVAAAAVSVTLNGSDQKSTGGFAGTSAHGLAPESSS